MHLTEAGHYRRSGQSADSMLDKNELETQA